MPSISRADLWKNWAQFFSPLRLRNLQIYWSGQAISLIGMWLQITAMQILTYHLSHGSATAVGILSALNSAPFIFGGAFLASLGDKFDRRKIIIIVQIAEMLIAGGLCILCAIDALALWHLFLAGFLIGMAESIAFPVQQAFVGDLVPPNKLMEAIGMYSLIFNLCRALGPPLGGFAIAHWGATFSFGANSVSYVPLIGCLIILSGQYTSQRSNKNEPEKPAQRKSSGWRTVLEDKHLLCVLVSTIIQNAFCQSLYQIVPAITYGDEHATGIILGSIGFGAVISILLLLPFSKLSPRIGVKLSIGTLWMGASIFTAGLTSSLYIQSGCFFLAGLATSALFVTASSTVQILAPADKKSTILGIFTIVTVGAQPLAALGWGALIDATSASTTVLTVSTTQVLLSLAMLCIPFWTKWRMRMT